MCTFIFKNKLACNNERYLLTLSSLCPIKKEGEGVIRYVFACVMHDS